MADPKPLPDLRVNSTHGAAVGAGEIGREGETPHTVRRMVRSIHGARWPLMPRETRRSE
jgi:hypothetical protein